MTYYFVITSHHIHTLTRTHTHTANQQVPLPYQGHRHGGGAKPVAPVECRARHCTLCTGTRRDSGDGAVCHGTLHTTVCADYLSAIRSRSIAFVPGLLSCTLCKRSARTRRRVLSGMFNVLYIMTCLHENA